MSKTPKKTQGDQPSAPAASSMSSSSAWSGGFQGGRLAALAATASDEAAAEARPASRAVDDDRDGAGGEGTPSLPQQVLMSLFDHPLFRRGIMADGGNDEGSGNGPAGDPQQAKARARPSLSQAFTCGGVGGGGETEQEPGAAVPFSSLQQPLPLPPRSGDGNNDHENDNDHGGEQEQEGELSSSRPASKALGLTRAFSTPESWDRYRPLLGVDGDDNDGLSLLRRRGHHGHSSRGDGLARRPDLRQAATSEDDLLKLERDYPLLLQRSASSAFGSPAALGRFHRGCGASRSGSNSGNSDPGASAFHPVWR